MTCKEFSSRVNELIDGELQEHDEEVARRHLEACSSCGRLLAELENLKGLIRQKAREIPPAPLALKSALAERWAPSRHAAVHRRGRLAAAAVIIVGVAAVLIFLTVAKSRLTHASVSAGCVEEFRRTFTRSLEADIADARGGNLWEESVKREVAARFGLTLRELPPMKDATFLRWHPMAIRGVEAVRIDFHPRRSQAPAGDGATQERRLLSLFLLPLKRMKLSDEFRQMLARGHSCTACVSMEGGNIFCFSDNDVLFNAVGNMGACELLHHLGME